MMHNFDPFSKAFDDVQVEDLETLKNVSEGWYIEYKRQMPNAGSVAKSISAFANTYGGWLFYGITEKSKEEPVAGSFLGIPRSDADGALQRMRQSVANHLQPTPFFRVKALYGPSEILGLDDDQCILMVYVPWGADAPFIHRNGKIYRRVGDGSEPKPENDRFVLDQLFGRGAKISEHHAKWIDRELELSNTEDKSPYLRIFLISDFWGDQGHLNEVPLARVREIMQQTDEHQSLPFDSIYRTSGNIVCRQTHNNDPESLALTWILNHDFRSEIIVPLPKFKKDDLSSLSSHFKGYQYWDAFSTICHKQKYHSPTVIDLNMLLIVLLALSRKQTSLAKEFGWTGTTLAKIEISGIWRTIPFLDTPATLDQFGQHGVPLLLRDKISLYQGVEPSSYISLPSNDPEQKDRSLVIGAVLFLHIAAALGISAGLNIESEILDTTNSFNDIFEAGKRARQVQKLRNPDLD